jgi:hypothetical protein
VIIMSIAPQEIAVVQPIRRRRRRTSVEIKMARDAWRTRTIAAGLRCDRCGDAACVIVDERRFCGDCYLVHSAYVAQEEGAAPQALTERA